MTRFPRLLAALALLTLANACSAQKDDADDVIGETMESALTEAVADGSQAVTTGDVRLREEASLEATVLRVLLPRTKVKILEGRPQNGFYRIELADGATGWSFGGYLRLESNGGGGGGEVGEAVGETFRSRGTGYYPDASPLEGGFVDRRGARLRTLQAYLAGDAEYVSVAMDTRAFPYGQKLRIRELERKYGREIEFRVVDTGGAFRGRGRTRMDICTKNEAASLDPTINGMLTVTIVD